MLDVLYDFHVNMSYDQFRNKTINIIVFHYHFLSNPFTKERCDFIRYNK